MKIVANKLNNGFHGSTAFAEATEVSTHLYPAIILENIANASEWLIKIDVITQHIWMRSMGCWEQKYVVISDSRVCTLQCGDVIT